jgi:hypothetical protein
MFSRGELLMEAAGREKRRFVRRHCARPIELGTGGTSYPLTSETSDVSPCGCYVTLLSTLAVGAVLDIILWAGETRLAFQATVRTADVSVGNGIDFTGISAEQQNRLQSYLDEIKAPVADSDFIFR